MNTNHLVTISWPDKLFLTKVVKCKILEITRFSKLFVLGIFYRFLFTTPTTLAVSLS